MIAIAMKIALQELGYANVYHFFQVAQNSSHADLWIEALKAKYEHDGESKHPGSNRVADWNQLLGEYSVSTPCHFLFCPESSKLY